MDAGVPILGGFNGFHSIEFTDTFQALVDELPGAGAIVKWPIHDWIVTVQILLSFRS